MSMHRYAVRVRKAGRYVWRWDCDGCGCWQTSTSLRKAQRSAFNRATRHAARCSDLHWRNWDAACPSCKAFGKVAKACPQCLGRGWVA